MRINKWLIHSLLLNPAHNASIQLSGLKKANLLTLLFYVSNSKKISVSSVFTISSVILEISPLSPKDPIKLISSLEPSNLLLLLEHILMKGSLWAVFSYFSTQKLKKKVFQKKEIIVNVFFMTKAMIGKLIYYLGLPPIVH